MINSGIVLGHRISQAGIEVDQAKLVVVEKLPFPETVKGVRSFLGHAGFYRRFIQDFSKISKPLCLLLEKNAKFSFTEECKAAFQLLKWKLSSASIICTPDWNLDFEIMADASDQAIGAVLGQKHGKVLHPIYYVSKLLNEAQQNYTTIEKELLAVMHAVEKSGATLLVTKLFSTKTMQ